MKKTFIFSLGLLIVVVMLTGCTGRQIEEFIGVCDKLQEEFDKLDNELTALTDKINEKKVECDEFPNKWQAAANTGASSSELDDIVAQHNACNVELEAIRAEYKEKNAEEEPLETRLENCRSQKEGTSEK